jgi:hypothetical protein
MHTYIHSYIHTHTCNRFSGKTYTMLIKSTPTSWQRAVEILKYAIHSSQLSTNTSHTIDTHTKEGDAAAQSQSGQISDEAQQNGQNLGAQSSSRPEDSESEADNSLSQQWSNTKDSDSESLSYVCGASVRACEAQANAGGWEGAVEIWRLMNGGKLPPDIIAYGMYATPCIHIYVGL